ncbi:MAG TPA: polysaccharide deacetylase family protein [Dehalococcoidia bacterium]|nr:polysaccharide deacetylase family protein [Dehalococcoidia bacterium]
MSTRLVLKRLTRRTGLRRHHVAAARMCCERALLAAVPRSRTAASGRILCYHSVGTPAWGVNDVSPRRFAQHLHWLLDAGCRIVPAEAIARGQAGPRDVALTFDDNLASVERNAAPLLASVRVPWTLFVVTDWAEGRHDFERGTFLDWAAIERLAGQGAAIGSHSVTHPNFGRLDEHRTVVELEQSRQVIEQRLGIVPQSFAIPLGQSDNWNATAQATAEAAGYELVYAQAGETRPAGTVARTFITRFDGKRLFNAALRGAFDTWEEWV